MVRTKPVQRLRAQQNPSSHKFSVAAKSTTATTPTRLKRKLPAAVSPLDQQSHSSSSDESPEESSCSYCPTDEETEEEPEEFLTMPPKKLNPRLAAALRAKAAETFQMRNMGRPAPAAGPNQNSAAAAPAPSEEQPTAAPPPAAGGNPTMEGEATSANNSQTAAPALQGPSNQAATSRTPQVARRGKFSETPFHDSSKKSPAKKKKSPPPAKKRAAPTAASHNKAAPVKKKAPPTAASHNNAKPKRMEPEQRDRAFTLMDATEPIYDSDDESQINDTSPFDGDFPDGSRHFGLGDLNPVTKTAYSHRHRAASALKFLRGRDQCHQVGSNLGELMGCHNLTKPKKHLKCRCVRDLSYCIQQQFREVGSGPQPGNRHRHQALKEFWIDRLEKVIDVVWAACDNPDSEEPAIILCHRARPISYENNPAGAPGFIFQTGDPKCNIWLCAHGMAELLGMRQHPRFQALFDSHLKASLVSVRQDSPISANKTRGTPREINSVSVDGENHHAMIIQLLGVRRMGRNLAFHLFVEECQEFGDLMSTDTTEALHPNSYTVLTSNLVFERAMKKNWLFGTKDCINSSESESRREAREKKQSAKKPGAKKPEVATNSFEPFRKEWSSIATRLSTLINGGDLSIASQSIVAKGYEKVTLDESWIGTRMMKLSAVGIADFDGNNQSFEFTHGGDAGATDVTSHKPLLRLVDRSIMLTGGWDGRSATSRMGPINGDETTHFYSSTDPKEGGSSLCEVIKHLCDQVDPTTLHQPSKPTEKPLTEDGLLDLCRELADDLQDFCYQLVPSENRGSLVSGFTAKVGAGVLRTLPDQDHYGGPFTCQVWHTDHEWDFYLKLAKCGVFGFIVSIPVTEEGCFLKIYDKSIGPDSPFQPDGGHTTFIPFGQAFAQPISSVHAGGIRTGPLGNPRMHLVVFLCSNEFKAKWSARSFFPRVYVTNWLTKPSDGSEEQDTKAAASAKKPNPKVSAGGTPKSKKAKLTPTKQTPTEGVGAHSVKHSGKNKSVFVATGTESRQSLSSQHSDSMNEVITMFGW